jgi:hypothetical protein
VDAITTVGDSKAVDFTLIAVPGAETIPLSLRFQHAQLGKHRCSFLHLSCDTPTGIICGVSGEPWPELINVAVDSSHCASSALRFAWAMADRSLC